MTTTYKVLGQIAPSALSNSVMYTVPTETSTVCSTLSICNRGASTTFRIAIVPAGDTIEDKHYLVYDNWVNQYDTVMLTLGITLAAGDTVTVYSGDSTLSFSLFGSELTA
jgi:hypothetical protein